MTIRTCGSCLHCQRNPYDPTNFKVRVCLRYPPTVTIQLNATSGAAVGQLGQGQAYPAITNDTPACGEYTPRKDQDVRPAVIG